MNAPWSAEMPLKRKDWECLRTRLIFDYCKWDIQSDDHSVVSDFPLVLEQDAWDSLTRFAEKLASEAASAELELFARADLYARLGLPPKITKALRACSPENAPLGAARVMRFDFHFTSGGWRISEVNADVPGGFIEASGLNELMIAHHPRCSLPPNPVSAYVDAISSAVAETGAVALIHATAHCDDRQVMEYLARILRRKGVQTVIAAPTHLKWESGVARIDSSFASAKAGLLVRFFPAEWLPNLRPSSAWTSWFCGGKTHMSNPASALLIQSKRFPLVWNDLKTPFPAWRSLLPETKCPSELAPDPADWVLKPVFGRVGEDIAIRGVTEPRAYEAIVKDVRRHPTGWIAQRRFDAVPIETPSGLRYACIGVFTLDGRAIGAYGRIASKPLIDQDAQDVAILLRRRDGSN